MINDKIKKCQLSYDILKYCQKEKKNDCKFFEELYKKCLDKKTKSKKLTFIL
tara:strand:+ start:811 stop:966 length:156 start_codon:yes stop_codon:yes gene_type:complete